MNSKHPIKTTSMAKQQRTLKLPIRHVGALDLAAGGLSTFVAVARLLGHLRKMLESFHPRTFIVAMPGTLKLRFQN